MSTASVDTTGFFEDSSHASADSIHFLRSNTMRLQPVTFTSQKIFLSLAAFRVLNALCLQTFFQPDEYFQSLEPAWQIVFGGDSGAWITWEWNFELRSSLHPVLFAVVYYIASSVSWLLHLSPLLSANFLIAAPKVTQAVIAAVGDYYTWKLAGRIYRPDSIVCWTTLALTVLSPWQWFCSTRTFSNCLETSLTVVALYYWPWAWSSGLQPAKDDVSDENGPSTLGGVGHVVVDREPKKLFQLRLCLLLAAIACILRPTNILVWATLAGFVLLKSPRTARIILAKEAAICGCGVLVTASISDRLYYGTWTFPPLKFLYFNVAQSISMFYGRNDWHYYLSQGFPLLLTTALPFAGIGLYQSLIPCHRLFDSVRPVTIRCQLAIISLFMPLVLSVISHKEVRFIYPLLPVLHVLSSGPVISFFLPAVSNSSSAYQPRRLILLFLVLINVVIAYYTTILHASGSLRVLSYLREQHQIHQSHSNDLGFSAPTDSSSIGSINNMTVGFLMPCHSTPWRSHLVFPSIHAWSLTCEPPVGLDAVQKKIYRDEADRFYDDPEQFLRKSMAGGLWHQPRKPSYLSDNLVSLPSQKQPDGIPIHEWPDYLVFFAQLEPTLDKLLRGSFYAECYRTFNTDWHDDWRRRGDVVVWCLDQKEQRKQHEKLVQRRSYDAQIGGIGHNTAKETFSRAKHLFRKANPWWREYVPLASWWSSPQSSWSFSSYLPSSLTGSQSKLLSWLSWRPWPWTRRKQTWLERLTDIRLPSLPSSWRWTPSNGKKKRGSSLESFAERDLWA